MRRWLWLAPFALAFAPTVAWLYGHWTSSVYRNGHGIFVPFVMAYLAYEHLKQDPDPEPKSSAWGFAFLVPALVLLAIDAPIKTEILSAFALVLALPGLSLLLLGKERTRALALPLVLGLFMLPIPAGVLAPVHPVLQQITAVGTEWVLPLFGVRAWRDDLVLHVPGVTVMVAENCSGFASLYASILTAIVLVYLVRSPRRRLAIALSVVPLALFVNVLRVAALVLLSMRYGVGILDTWVHSGTGVAVFAIVIPLLFWIAGPEAMRSAPGRGLRTPLSARFAPAAAALCALALVPVGVHAYAQRRGDDCAAGDLLAPAVTGDGERAAFMATRFDTDRFREGKLAPTRGAPEMSFTVIRSWNPKNLYYRGTRRLWEDVEGGADRIEWIESDDGALPIVRSSVERDARTAPSTVIAALLVYDGRPVASGWRAQLEDAPRQLLGGAQPMTMFAVRADVRPDNRSAAEARAHAFLLESWRNYRALCRREAP
jgi:exosortase